MDSECNHQERLFALDLYGFLQREDAASEYITYQELKHENGRIDIAIVSKYHPEKKYVIELKSEDNAFSKINEQRAGQALAYVGKTYSRICIMYSQFGGENIRLADALEVRDNLGPTSALAVVCIGHRAFGQIPSKSGKSSKSVG